MRRTGVLLAALAMSVPLTLAGSMPVAGATTVCQTTAYVTAFGGNLLTPIDAPTRTPLANILLPSGTAPVGIAITRDGTTAFVAYSAMAEVAVVDLTTGTVDPTTIPVGNSPQDVELTPDG